MKYKSYIYSNRASGEPLLRKLSLGEDFTIETKSIATRLELNNAGKEIGSFEITGAENELLKRKIHVLLLLRTNLHLVRMDIERKFGSVQNMGLSSTGFKRYMGLVEAERKSLLEHIDAFWSSLLADVEALASVERVDGFYRNLVHNFNIGLFAPTNRERLEQGEQTD